VDRSRSRAQVKVTRRRALGRLTSKLPAGLSINQLAQDVGVTRMPGSLFQKVHEYPAEIDWRLIADVSTHLIETRSDPDHGIGSHPDFLVRGDGRFDRVVCID
jgi:hypothetical protein